MSGEVKDIFAHVIADTLEGLAFIFAFDEGESRKPDGPCARLGFAGPFSGIFFLSVDDSLLDEMTENMLGLDEGASVSRSQREDALKEAANVICGNLLPQIGGRDAVFDLLPAGVYREGLEQALNGETPLCEVTLSVDESVCRAALWVEDEKVLEGLR
jgi:CheY-specific phosphatase CheX